MRRQPFYAKALNVLNIEANCGGWPAANRVADLFQPKPENVDAVLRHKDMTGGKSLGNIVFMQKDPEGGTDRGVWTSDEQLEGGAELLRQALESNTLRIADNFVSRDAKAFLTKLRVQLLNFREEIGEAKDPIFGKPKRKLTGKSGGRQDDIVVTIMLSLFWWKVLRRIGSFRNYCRKQGIPLY